MSDLHYPDVHEQVICETCGEGWPCSARQRQVIDDLAREAEALGLD